MSAPSTLEHGHPSSLPHLGGLSLPASHGEVRKGPLWLYTSTPALLQESFH